MNFLQIAGKDIKTIFKNRIIRVSIIAIIIVPLLYSLLYLDAFWDPYSKLEDMPVAVVNLDKGTELDGEKVNYGDGIIDNLKDSSQVGWEFVSEEEATAGLEGNDYYAIFEISEDFSKNVVSAKQGSPETAGLKFICNEKKNFLASQVNSKVESALKEKIVSTITNNYVKVAFDNLYTVKDGMVEAADGSGQINDGLKTLNGKVPELVSGVTQLKDGSDKLYNGQNVLGKGITELYNGVGQQLQPGVIAIDGGLSELNGNVPALSTGINDLYAGSLKLAEGTTVAKSGSQELVDGTTTAKSGSQELADGTQKLYTGYTTKIYPSIVQLSNGAKALDTALTSNKESINSLGAAASELTTASEQIKAGSLSIKNGYTNVEAGVNQLITGVDASKQTMEDVSNDLIVALSAADDGTKDTKIKDALKKLQDYKTANVGTDAKIQGIKSGMSGLDTGISQFNGYVNQYTTGVNSFAQGTTALVNSVGSVQTGVTQINGGLGLLQTSLDNEFGPGLNKVNTGAVSLNDGVSKINTGTLSLNGGLSEINTGVISLNDGLGKINGKTPDLINGITKLYNGSNQLVVGVNNLYDGSSKLASGSKELVDGQGQLKDGVNTLQSKIPDLKDGVSKLYDGTSELSTSLSDGANKLDDGLVNSSEDMASFVSSPVEMKVEPINAVPNYGTGFAPYFMNLSLWIGAIMMFFVISSKTDEYEGVSRIHKAFGKFLSFAFIGVLQSVLVGIAVLALGLVPENIFLYFGMLIFCSLVFIAIVQFLISLFGDAGRLLSIVFLILQLTACEGTFPLELVPGFFKVLNPFMPFTYAVEAFREICSASVIDYGIIAKDVIVLGIFFVVFLGGSIIFKHTGDKIQAIMEGKKEEAFQ